MPDRIPSDWSPLRIVTDADGLALALEEWRAEGLIGLDTESNSFFAYTDKLCLVQVTAGDQDWILDPLALGEDLKMINEVLEDPEFPIILHAAEFDLMLLKKDLGVELKGLFDTQVAMTLLKHEKTGLAALIDSYYGIKLSKKEQRSNWGRRPLSEAQYAYARIDTHFLPELRDRLIAELEEKKMTAIAEGEFRRQESEILPPREPNFEAWRKMKGAKTLDPKAAARLQELFRWREESAMKLDRPVFRVMANETLMELAKHPARSTKELAGRKGIGWNKARKVGSAILEALQAADGQEVSDHRPKAQTPLERKRNRIRRENREELRKWRKREADALELPPERIMHRRHLDALCGKLPTTREDLSRTIPLNDWQREHLEDNLLGLLESLPNPETITEPS